MWSRKYDKCTRCGTVSIPHRSKGLCNHCYSIHENNKFKTQTVKTRNVHKTILTKEFLIKEYLDKNKSSCDISKETGIDRRQIFRYLKKYDIPLRTFTEARTLALKNEKLKTGDTVHHITTYQNEDYFKKWSKEMAYVFGVLFTDGNLYQKGNLKRTSFSQKTIELPEKILKLINCDATIGHREEKMYGDIKSGEVYYFSLNNSVIYNDLITLGMTPNKSKTMQFPKTIPDEFISHFIRGCWDGNGSVTIDNKSVNARIVSGSSDFVYQLRDKLEHFGITEGKILKEKNRESYTLYYFGWRGDNLLSFIYRDSVEETRLNRKYENYILHLKRTNPNAEILSFNVS